MTEDNLAEKNKKSLKDFIAWRERKHNQEFDYYFPEEDQLEPLEDLEINMEDI